MAQFIKIGQRFINMDRVEYVVLRENGELRVGLNEGVLYLDGKEAEEMMYWLDNYAQDIIAWSRPHRDEHDDPDGRMERYFTEATAAELRAPVWHPE